MLDSKDDLVYWVGIVGFKRKTDLFHYWTWLATEVSSGNTFLFVLTIKSATKRFVFSNYLPFSFQLYHVF